MSVPTSPRFAPPRERDPRAEEQSRIAKERNKRIIRVGLTENGYLITTGDNSEQWIAATRSEVHARIDEFFDRLHAPR